MTQKVLIANRGEIACRVMKTCQKMGFGSVAVYSDADETAMHVRMADEAHHIGGAAVRESYLNMDRIIEVAQQTGATLIHPGYGLLSENPEFARKVEAAGLSWVGPRPDSMIAMADKERARAIAGDAGVPVLKGSDRIAQGDDVDFEAIGCKIGFPALVKAVAGGGGIGMKICKKAKSLEKTAQMVAELAERTFGDGTVIIERYIERARHVEIQVFGLGDGRVLTLFDRDCSTQRRFQKVIEEAPAPNLPESVRAAMAEAASRLAASQNYRGAGTVEFIVDAKTNEFFFLEMNTRLQVEHPITEMITGLDIVSMQLELAVGENLDALVETPVVKSGHAIECRIYAENPERKFFPSPGEISKFAMPEESGSVRVDTGVTQGSTITPFYDPLIAKLSCAGTNRDEARKTLVSTLEQIEIQGLNTNVAFLLEFIRSPQFDADALNTKVIEAFFESRAAEQAAE